jgi:hypothetical protein
MAIGTPKFPLDKITGVLGKVDRSVSRAKGLGLNISSSKKSSILGVKTQRTTTRTIGQQERAKIYCDCDHGWAAMGLFKQLYTCKYQREVRQKSSQRYTHYTCWMSLCLTDAWDENLFLLNSYVSRYVIKNTSGAPWIGHKVTLNDIPTKQANGWDVAIQETDYKRLPQRTLEHKVNAKGSVIVCLPDMTPGRTIYIDVYSYGDYSTPQNCPVASQAEYDQSMLDDTTFGPSFFLGYDVNISFTPPVSGYLYAYLCQYYCGSGTKISGLSSNTPEIRWVGPTGKSVWGIPISIATFGHLIAGQTYTISGHLTDPGGEACGCGTPAAFYPEEIYYSGPYTGLRKYLYLGHHDDCSGDWAPWEMFILHAESYTEYAPESTTKIGPT